MTAVWLVSCSNTVEQRALSFFTNEVIERGNALWLWIQLTWVWAKHLFAVFHALALIIFLKAISDEYEMSWVKSISRRGKNTKLWIFRSAQVFVIKNVINCLQCSACVQRCSNPISSHIPSSHILSSHILYPYKDVINCLQCSACVQRWSNPISHALAGSEGGDAVEGAFESL